MQFGATQKGESTNDRRGATEIDEVANETKKMTRSAQVSTR